MTRVYRILVCRGPECGDRHGSAAIHAALRAAIDARGLAGTCDLGWQSCFGRCTQGPNVLVRDVTPDDAARVTALYNGVDVVNVADLVEQHVEHGVVVSALVRDPSPALSPASPPGVRS